MKISILLISFLILSTVSFGQEGVYRNSETGIFLFIYSNDTIILTFKHNPDLFKATYIKKEDTLLINFIENDEVFPFDKSKFSVIQVKNKRALIINGIKFKRTKKIYKQ